ncbi:hypothetical protein [Acetivibrio cellulolyticus]|uniref:hypothetical protein n=1 Tax=Acetivibrio cellulolyticus TaxID=35830 RepID=UPI0001E2C75A|nr:hypothetical protein [Acetivibrio cellulolyticus]
MRRKIFTIMVICIFLLSSITSIYAEGDGNIDNGSGGMGSGTSQNSWTPGNDGVRVTVVDTKTGKTVGSGIDYTNKNPSISIIHFGKVSKIQYNNGTSLYPVKGSYHYKNPTNPMPKIISSASGKARIEAIKKYFCSDGAAKMIAEDVGINFDQLVNGNYKLLLEPIAYFKYQGIEMGMTAHEAALYDQLQSGALRSKMVSLTHKNLPLAMFLEKSDLGFQAWTGATSGSQSNSTILTYLGVGIVSYKDAPPTDPVDTVIEYRINTEVITAVTLNSSYEINPDSPATVTFNVGGKIYTMSNIAIPKDESQVVWCKWTTPSTEKNITITVSATKGYLSESVIKAKIVNLDKNTPPNPTANDKNNGFKPVSIPSKSQRTYATWSVWRVKWHANWVWISNWKWCDHGDWGHWLDNGNWVDKGWYDFYTDVYEANLTASSKIKPDIKSPTASYINMKSGYGINNVVQTNLLSSAPTSHITGAQTGVSYFPEFEYKTYWRLLQCTQSGYFARFEFKSNPYSTYGAKCHFTPIWYPNGQYKVYTYVLDAWTPTGMLSINLNDYVNVSGSLYDDWHIAPK